MLDNIKLFLGIQEDDEASDELLELIINLTTSRLKFLLGGILDVPLSMQYIVVEVSIARFNRIGSEGLKSHNVEGETQTFNDDDFASYKDDIQTYLDSQNANKSGKLRFM